MLVVVQKRGFSLGCLCLAAGLLGCSSLDSQKKQRDPFADAEEGSKDKDLSLDFITKAVKKATGKGPNREVAYKLFGEAQGLYSEAVAQRSKDADAARKAFAAAGEKFAKAADRWPDSALEEESLYLAGESRFFADRYPEAEDSLRTPAEEPSPNAVSGPGAGPAICARSLLAGFGGETAGVVLRGKCHRQQSAVARYIRAFHAGL